MKSVKFSIIVPVYKVEPYLRRCVDSLLAQNFDSFEIILVDDGSPDGCPAICDEYSQQNPRIRVIHKHNGGLSEARNFGIEAAGGEYVTFVDSDDFWKGSGILTGVWEIISRYSPDIVVSDFIKYYDDTEFYLEATPSDAGYNGHGKLDILSYLYYKQKDLKVSACQKFINRTLISSHLFTKGLLSEDIDWSIGLMADAKSICIYDKAYYCYRQAREGSITNTAAEKSFYSLMTIIGKWEKLIPELSVSNLEKEIYLGYLAYQLSIAMTIFPNLAKESKAAALLRLKSYRHLFNYPLNSKTSKVCNLTHLFGIRGSCMLLSFFVKARRFLKKG